MQEREINSLIVFLKKIGFEGQQLENDIRAQIKANLLSFKVKTDRLYNKELMKYELLLERDDKIPYPYRLSAIDVIYRQPVNIIGKIVGGIDITALDRDMEAVDWSRWHIHNETIIGPEQASRAGDILSRLAKLNSSRNPEANRFREQLMFKHLPAEMYRKYNKTDYESLKRKFERNFTFELDKWPYITADLAFLLVSERVDALTDSLMKLEINRETDIDLLPQIYRKLQKSPVTFEINGQYNTELNHVEFEVPVRKIDGWYSPDSYTVRITPYPTIEHGTYNGIDTSALESMICRVNWKNEEELFILHKDKLPDFKPEVSEIDELLFRLSLEPQGKIIADTLRLKYLRDVPFFGSNLPQSSWDLLDSLPKRQYEFPLEINLTKAVNLLGGKAVFNVSSQNLQGKEWIRLDRSNEKDNFSMRTFEGLPMDKIEEYLHMLPIPNFLYYPTKNRLLDGDRVKMKMDNGLHIIIEANPEEKTLNLFTTDMKPVPFNFHFNPHWRPESDKFMKSDPKLKWKKGKGLR